MCTEMHFSCGVGISTIGDGDDMCVENQNVENILANATYCYCDAKSKDMCHPSGSNALQVSILTLSLALTFVLRL